MTRDTFTVPDGTEPVLDAEGRATGEVTTTPNHEADAGVRVKPLEWKPESDGRYLGGIRPGFFHAEQYRLLPDDGAAYRIEAPNFRFLRDRFANLDEAKAAAQDDYEQRIRSALLPVPTPAAREPETGVSGEAGENPYVAVSLPSIDPQVITAAGEMDAKDKRAPEWLWFETEKLTMSFGRWGHEYGQQPYIRADIALDAIATLSASHHARPGQEEIRNEALEEAAKIVDAWTVPVRGWGGRTKFGAAAAIRSLKSPPHSTPPTSSKVATDDTLDGMAGQ